MMKSIPRTLSLNYGLWEVLLFGAGIDYKLLQLKDIMRVMGKYHVPIG